LLSEIVIYIKLPSARLKAARNDTHLNPLSAAAGKGAKILPPSGLGGRI